MRIYNKLEVTVCLLSTLGMVVEGVLMSKRIGGISFGMTIGIFYTGQSCETVVLADW